MATSHPRTTHFEHRWHRGLFGAGGTLALVLVLILNPDAALVYATNMFGALRAPGEAAFIAAHRGDRANFPENTLPALQAALEGDFDFVETDVQLTADGVPVLFHDETVERTTDGMGPLALHSLAQLKTLDAGSYFSPEFAGLQVPTLDEFLVLLADTGRKKAMVELKGVWTPDQVRAVTAMIYAHGVQARIIFESFEYPTLDALREAAPLIPRVLIQRYLPSDPVTLVERFGAIAVLTGPVSLEMYPDSVDKLHEAGLGIVLYTLNKKGRWSEALDLGVDGIITDKPSSLDDWLAENAPGT